MPNNICNILYVDKVLGNFSLDKCSKDSDCLPGLTCDNNKCFDASSNIYEQDRRVTVCVSPKNDKDSQAGCPAGGDILACHKYWISPSGMDWKHYLQFNPKGKGDAYSWAYDEAVCAKAGNQRSNNPDYPWCIPSEQQDTT